MSPVTPLTTVFPIKLIIGQTLAISISSIWLNPCNCGGTIPGSMSFSALYNFGDFLSLVHRWHTYRAGSLLKCCLVGQVSLHTLHWRCCSCSCSNGKGCWGILVIWATCAYRSTACNCQIMRYAAILRNMLITTVFVTRIYGLSSLDLKASDFTQRRQDFQSWLVWIIQKVSVGFRGISRGRRWDRQRMYCLVYLNLLVCMRFSNHVYVCNQFTFS